MALEVVGAVMTMRRWDSSEEMRKNLDIHLGKDIGVWIGVLRLHIPCC
jgi:hypothetical protein